MVKRSARPNPKDAKQFSNEADAWTFAKLSDEDVPNDCWVEPFHT